MTNVGDRPAVKTVADRVFSVKCEVASDVMAWDIVWIIGMIMMIFGAFGLTRFFRNQDKHRIIGPLFLEAYGVVCCQSAMCGGVSLRIWSSSPTARFPRLPPGSFSVFAGGMAVSSLLIFRLLCAKKFEGDVFDLDFGDQWSETKGWHPNKSCANMISLGHASQGMLSIFLFPWTEFKLLDHGWRASAVLSRFASLLLIGYPLYNLVKRLKKHREYFARCSFYENTLEWTMGFLFGLAVGASGTRGECMKKGEMAREIVDVDVDAFEDLWDILEWCRLIAGAALFIITVLAAFELHRSWDYMPLSEEGSSSREDASLTSSE